MSLAAAGLLVLSLGIALPGCSQEPGPLAPYLGARPLELLKVTQSFNPDIQWVGGRVAAVGVNRGTRAALDSTLVWIRTASGNEIGSVVTIGSAGLDRDYIQNLGGTPQDEMSDGETYTFWIADVSALSAGLDPAQFDEGAFAERTLTLDLVLRGRSGGDPSLGVQFQIVRDEEISGDRLVIHWTPSDLRFRRLAIRQATVGGFTNLIWHILVPADDAPSISSPLVIGDVPEGVIEVTAFPSSGFEPVAHTLWAVTDSWQESFALTAPGYAYFQIFASNFQP